MISERLLQLLAKQLGHEASCEELSELKSILQQYPENNFFVEILRAVEGEKSHREPSLGEDILVQESWLMLKQEMDDIHIKSKIPEIVNEIHGKKRLVRTWMRYAAIWGGIIILAGAFYVFKHLEKKSVLSPSVAIIKHIELPYGAPVKKVLPDSSEVWLNAGSHIRYDDNFIQKNRDVYLDGEAYFSVKHDAAHPFIVHAGNITVRALGTKFNVEAYPDENKIEATLIAGKIMIKIDGKPDQSIILNPNEKLTVTNEKFTLSHEKMQPRKELGFEVKDVSQILSIASVPEVAWLQDKLAFENESFDELAKKMERRYHVHIVFKDSLLGEERLSGVFENESIKKAMDLLQMTTSFHYQIRGDTTVFLNK